MNKRDTTSTDDLLTVPWYRCTNEACRHYVPAAHVPCANCGSEMVQVEQIGRDWKFVEEKDTLKPLLTGSIPLAPSINASKGIDTRGRSGKKAVVYLLPEVVAWQKAATLELYGAQHFLDTIHTCRGNGSPLYLSLTAYMPLDRLLARDADNFIKLTQDLLLNDYLAINDVRVFDVHAKKRECPEGTTPYIYLSLYEQTAFDGEYPVPSKMERKLKRKAA